MDIKNDIKDFLDRTGMSQSELARQSEVPVASINRILTGARAGIHSTTWEKIVPIIYGKRKRNAKVQSTVETS